jgi:hypothetical protein
MNGSIVSPRQEDFVDMGLDDEVRFRLDSARYGVRVPGQQRMNREIAEERAARERAERERQKREEAFADDDGATWGVREV